MCLSLLRLALSYALSLFYQSNKPNTISLYLLPEYVLENLLFSQ